MNTIKTTMLMALLMALMVALGGVFAGQTGMTVMLVIALGMNFFSYWFSDRMVLSMYNAREVDRTSAPELYGLVEKLAGRAGLPIKRGRCRDDGTHARARLQRDLGRTRT